MENDSFRLTIFIKKFLLEARKFYFLRNNRKFTKILDSRRFSRIKMAQDFNFCGCHCNIFRLSIILTLIEIVLTVFIIVIRLFTRGWNNPYILVGVGVILMLCLEYYGTILKIYGVMIFNCIVRCIQVCVIGVILIPLIQSIIEARFAFSRQHLFE